MNSDNFEQLQHLVLLFRTFYCCRFQGFENKEVYLSFYVGFVLQTSFIYNSQVEQT